MADYYFRTENIKAEDLPSLLVKSNLEEDILTSLKSSSNIVVEGSRGTGKSFLMRYSSYELETLFASNKILPVYITFMASTLIHTSDNFQFRNWMLARILREFIKSAMKNGLVVSSYASSLLNTNINETAKTKLNEVVAAYENSYKNPGQNIDASALPEINDIVDALNNICEENNLKGIYFYFDEAAHIFRPEQQRQFFTLFRDLRSPYISSKAAVYPGVTHFGDTFEITHDSNFKKVERSITDSGYLNVMMGMIEKQIDSGKKQMINAQKELFNTILYSANGNPRILLKTVERLTRLTSNEVDNLMRTFYRTEIWSEHTSLGTKFKGHKALVDWGRKFIEDNVIPNLIKKSFNDDGSAKNETSIYFWIHKDAPIQVKESLRLLTYTGIIYQIDSGVKGSWSQVGTRYGINYGVFLSQINNPSRISKDFLTRLQIDRFTSYGQNHAAYNELLSVNIFDEDDKTLIESLNAILTKSIQELDLTNWQKNKLINDAKFTTIKELMDTSEAELISRLEGVGVVRSRQMKNAAYAEVLEYISG